MKNHNFQKVIDLENLAIQIHFEKYGSLKNSTGKQREECRKLAAIHLGLLTQ